MLRGLETCLGLKIPFFWQYTNSTIDDLTQKLIFNNFTSESERNNLLQKAESVGINEAVRLFFARSFDPYIASSQITGLINDYSTGIANKLSLLNAQKKCHRQFHSEHWYDTNISRGME